MRPFLRDATLEDLPAVTALYALEVEGGTATFETTPPGLEEMAQRFAAVKRHARWRCVRWVAGGCAGSA